MHSFEPFPERKRVREGMVSAETADCFQSTPCRRRGTSAILILPHGAAVRRLQADRGLGVDGIAGPETLMALAADDAGGPRLAESLE